MPLPSRFARASSESQPSKARGPSRPCSTPLFSSYARLPGLAQGGTSSKQPKSLLKDVTLLAGNSPSAAWDSPQTTAKHIGGEQAPSPVLSPCHDAPFISSTAQQGDTPAQGPSQNLAHIPTAAGTHLQGSTGHHHQHRHQVLQPQQLKHPSPPASLLLGSTPPRLQSSGSPLDHQRPDPHVRPSRFSRHLLREKQREKPRRPLLTARATLQTLFYWHPQSLSRICLRPA